MKRFALAALVAALFLPALAASAQTPAPSTSRTYVTDTPGSVNTAPSPTTRLVVNVNAAVSENSSYSLPVNFDPAQAQNVVVNYTLPGATAPSAANLTTSTGQSIQFQAVYINGYSLTVNTTFTPTTPGMATLAATLTQTVPTATAGH